MNDDDSDDDDNGAILFDKTKRQLTKLFHSISNGNRVSTKLSAKTIESKKRIKAHIKRLTDDIRKTLKKREILLRIKKSGILPGRVIWIYKPKQFDSLNWCLNNSNKSRTCHVNCSAWGKKFCVVFINEHCKICGHKKSSHVYEKKYWGWDITYKYDECSETLDPTKLISELEVQLYDLETTLYGGLGGVVKFINELKDIALKPINCDIITYIDKLYEIESKKYDSTVNVDVLQFLLDLKKPNVINAINDYIETLDNKGIKFSDLNYNDLQRYYKEIRDVVSKVFITKAVCVKKI